MKLNTNPINASPKIGILGGGQLGLMLIEAAIRFNLDISILDAAHAPCSKYTSKFTAGAFTDYDAVMSFGKDLDIITIEIENVNIQALLDLQALGKKIYPQPELIALIQDKRIQKQFYLDNHIPTAPFILTDNLADIETHADFLPAFHKLAKEGYDGKGVQKLNSIADIPLAFNKPSLLEKLVPFHKEITVIAARNENGETSTYDPVELIYHEQNMVDYLIAPAVISDNVSDKARQLATLVINKLELIGILAVEMFLLEDGTLLVNEIAPRPHNSGHHSIEACFCSQFEQHWRAILGLPLGNPALRSPAAMINLIGEPEFSGAVQYNGLDTLLRDASSYLHLYGKTETRPYRKMGHITILRNEHHSLIEAVNKLKSVVKVVA